MKIIQAALGRGRISGAAAALGIAALVLLVSQAASARAVTPSAALTKTGSASGPRPSIVLVHGAWADSSSWDAVVTRLQRDGYTVYVPPNPLLGLRYDPAFLRDFLNTLSGPIVLVRHSYGGPQLIQAFPCGPLKPMPGCLETFAPAQRHTTLQRPITRTCS